MGGNLFKVKRISKEEYTDICNSLNPILDKHFCNSYRIPIAYRNKKDYGDVDVIVDGGILMNRPDWKEELSDDLGVIQTHSTGNVYSMLYRDFQVDIKLIGGSKLESCYNFMSYNILGNLMGRIFHKFNMKYGEEGLSYVLRGYNNHISKEICVSRDIKKILEFIGLSYDTWKNGFDDLEDIFNYIIKSKYFCSNSYDLSYFNIEKRATQRPDFNKFLDFIKNNNVIKNYPFKPEKEIYIKKIDKHFGSKIQKSYSDHIAKQAILEAISKKINGKVIMDLIPRLSGKHLGRYINDYNESFGKDYESKMMSMTQEEINKSIIDFYNNNFILKKDIISV